MTVIGAGAAPHPQTGWAATRGGRATRTAVASVLTVGLAVAAHVLACGRAPETAATLVSAVLVTRVCWGVSENRVPIPRLVGLVLTVQACLHVAFALSAPAGHAGMRGGQAHVALTVAPVHLVPGATMVVLHLTAAMFLAGWLALGEHLLWQVARGAVRVARRAVERLHRARPNDDSSAPVGNPLLPAHHGQPAHAISRWLRHVVVRRGPPCFAA